MVITKNLNVGEALSCNGCGEVVKRPRNKTARLPFFIMAKNGKVYSAYCPACYEKIPWRIHLRGRFTEGRDKT